jgi:hypothetical protein
MEIIVLMIGLVSITGIICHAQTTSERLNHKRRMRELEHAREQRLLSAHEGDEQ